MSEPPLAPSLHFIDSEFLVKTRDHLPNPGLGKSFVTDWMVLLQAVQALFESMQFLLRLLAFSWTGNS